MTRTRTALRRSLAALAIAGLSAAGVVVAAAPAHAAVFEVTSTADAGGGTLRQAIEDANSGAFPGADTITFQPGLGTIVITGGTIEITEALTITGPGAANLSISNQSSSDLFTITNMNAADALRDVVIEELDFIGNLAGGRGVVADGAGNDARNITLRNTTWGGFTTSSLGGAVSIDKATGNVTISGSNFSANSATGPGGALYVRDVDGAVTITNSVFQNNLSTASDGGAAWIGQPDNVQITGSTFANNTAFGPGGALILDQINNASLIERTSFTGNRAGDNGSFDTFGGAMYVQTVQFNTTLTIRQSSILDSRLEAGIDEAYGAGLYFNTIAGEVLIDSSTVARGLFVDSTNAPAPGSGLSIALCAIATGSLNIINSTFDEGQGLDAYVIHGCEVVGGGDINIAYSTLVGPGILTIEENDGNSSITSSILDASTLPAVFINNQGAPVDVEWSLLSTALNTDYVTDGGGNRFNVADPLLGPLQNNGGPTPTRLLLPGSPALDTGNPAVSGQPSFDQRGTGFPRVNGRIDIGAIEMPRTLPATGAPNDGAVGLAAILLLIAGIGLVAQARRAISRRESRTTA